MSGATGTVIAAHGRHYLVQTGDEKLQCVTRGKKSDVAVGDIVELKRTSPNQAVIESIHERRTLLYRSDQYKSKLLSANLTQLFIVVATEPGYSDDLVSRALVAVSADETAASLAASVVSRAAWIDTQVASADVLASSAAWALALASFARRMAMFACEVAV